KDIKPGPLDLKKSYTKPVVVPENKGPGGMGVPGGAKGEPAKTADGAATAPPPKAKGDGLAEPPKPADKDLKPIPPATDDPPKKAGKDDVKKDAPDAKKEPPKPKPEKITWTEQARWRDGMPARLQGTGNHAYYLTRKVVSTAARTAMVQIDGPVGFKMWI